MNWGMLTGLATKASTAVSGFLTGKVMAYIVGALFLALLTIGWLYRQEVRAGGEIRERAKGQASTILQQREALRQAMDELTERDRMSIQREKDRAKMRGQLTDLKRRLQDMRGKGTGETYENYRACRDVQLPADVLERLRSREN